MDTKESARSEAVPEAESTVPVRQDVDPSTGRSVPHKFMNNGMMEHKRWRDREARKAARRKALAEGKTPPPPHEDDDAPEFSFWANMMMSTVVAIMIGSVVALLAGQFVQGDPLWGYRGKWTNWHTYFPQKFPPEFLARFNGETPGKPILLAIMGDVYDVTKGSLHYGVGGPYHMFAGRDASRAYVTGCFSTHLTHDTRGLTPEQQRALRQWHAFYENHPVYYKVGTVENAPISPDTPIPPPCEQPISQKP